MHAQMYQEDHIKQMEEKEHERLRKIEERKALKALQEQEGLTFSPKINERSHHMRKRTLNEMIVDLYEKPFEKQQEALSQRSQSRGAQSKIGGGSATDGRNAA